MISIIIPTYNEENVISDCLKSLEKQTFTDFEVIVVDDSSKDKTLQILSDLRSTTYSLKVIRQEHSGPGAARNLGSEHAKGNILVFVDSDMTFDKNFLRMLIKPIVAGKTKGTFSKDEFVSNWDNKWSRCWNINENWEDRKRHPKKYPDHQPVFRAILISEFKKVGGFTPGGYDDDWSLSKKLGYEATLADNAVFYHKNPENLREVYYQARWAAKRHYKFSGLGTNIAWIRSDIFISILIGLIKSIRYKNFNFLIFKIVYDWGIFNGIMDGFFSGNKAK